MVPKEPQQALLLGNCFTGHCFGAIGQLYDFLFYVMFICLF